jgi:hypothetical protein
LRAYGATAVLSRRTASLLAGLCVALTLAGVAAASATDPKVAITAADQAWAEAIVLTGSDLGKGWSASEVPPAGDTGSTTDDTDDSSACPGGIPDESDLTATGGVGSPEFQRGESSVSSAAIIWQTAEQAQADWERWTTAMPAFMKCVASVFTGTIAGLKVTVAVNGPLAVFAGAAPRVSAYRLKIVFKPLARRKKKAKPLIAYFDVAFFGAGRAFGWAFMDSFSPKPLTLAYERTLIEKMAARMANDPAAVPVP